MKETALAKTNNDLAKPTSFAPTNFQDAMEFAKIIAKTDFVPKDYKNKPGNVLIAIQWGAEIGVQPMQAMQNIACINGRPSIYGDLALALCLASCVCEYVNETFDEPTMTATCAVKRRGGVERVETFSQADAEKAGLWQTEAKVTRYKKGGGGKYTTDNDSPWFRYPKRMLQMRARGFALRDAFPDVLKGLITAEEARDYPVNVQTNKPAPGAQNQPEKVSRTEALKNKLAEKSGDVIDADVEEVPNLEDLKAEADCAETEEELTGWYKVNVSRIELLSEKDQALIVEHCGERKTQIIGELESIKDQEGDEEFFLCPDEDKGKVPASFCEDCKALEGCPAHEAVEA